jgi:hypothetical protein
MAAFLFVMPFVALLVGLVGMGARHLPRATGRPQAPGASSVSR